MAVVKIPDGKGGWIRFPTIKGEPGKDGEVTKENIIEAVGFMPKEYSAGDNIAIDEFNRISVTGQLGLTLEEVKKVKVDSAKDADTVGGHTVAKDVPLDAKFTDTVVDISGKVDKVSGKGLSSNDFTNTEKNKLRGVEAGANNYQLPRTLPYSMLTGTPTIPRTAHLMPKSGGQLGTYTESVVSINNDWDGVVDLTKGNNFMGMVRGDNLTISIVGAEEGIHSFTLILATASEISITYPSEVLWVDRDIPSLKRFDQTIMTFVTYDKGQNWLAINGGSINLLER